MRGKTVAITGATSGVGRAAAEALAGLGARIVFVARDPVRAEETLTALTRANPDAEHAAVIADLASLAEVRRAGSDLAQACPRLDVLINNAGALFSHRRLSPDGLELTFALNHMAYFVLTEALRPTLAASAPARVVSTASIAHRRAQLDFSDLQSERGVYSGFAVYSRSKLCNILWTRELARRLEGGGVTANCLHPGFVASRFGDESGGLLQWLVPLAKRLAAISPEKGAQTIVHLASSPEVEMISGGYFENCRQAQPGAAARDDRAAAQLWAESEKLALVH